MVLIEFSHVKHGNEMLLELVNSPSVVSLKALENKLHLSRRSIFYVINHVNKELETEGLYEIENIRGIGYLLPDETRQQLAGKYKKDETVTDFASFFDSFPQFSKLAKNQRQLTEIFFLISRDTTSLNQLTNIFNTSKNTIIKDLNEIAVTLPNELFIKNFKSGKSIVGDETVQRSWVFEHLQSLLKLISPFFQPSSDSRISEHLQLFEKATGNILTDDSNSILNSYLQWLLSRIENQSYRLSSPLIKKIQPITTKVIQRFNQKAGVKLPAEVGSLNENLTAHLASTYCRVKFNIRYHNPLLERMKTNYRETFELTKIAVAPFNKFVNSTLSEDEIALITAYFSGAMRSWLYVPVELAPRSYYSHSLDSAIPMLDL